MTGTYTYTRTTVRYSTDGEIVTTRLLLNNFGVPDGLTNSSNFISGVTELAGIGRMQLNNTEMPKYSYMVDAHYDDAANLLDSIGVSNALLSRNIAWGVVHALADAIPASAEGATVKDTVQTLMQKLREREIKVGTKDGLSPETVFALGVAAHLGGIERIGINGGIGRK